MIMDVDSSGKVVVKPGYCQGELQERLLPVDEVARFLGVHSNTVRRWGESGLLRSYEIGLNHNLVFKQADVLKFFVLNIFDKYQQESA